MPEIREDAHVPEGLGFELANPLARDHELAADFLGGAAAPVHEAETQLEAALPDGRAASCALLTGPTDWPPSGPRGRMPRYFGRGLALCSSPLRRSQTLRREPRERTP